MKRVAVLTGLLAVLFVFTTASVLAQVDESYPSYLAEGPWVSVYVSKINLGVMPKFETMRFIGSDINVEGVFDKNYDFVGYKITSEGCFIEAQNYFNSHIRIFTVDVKRGLGQVIEIGEHVYLGNNKRDSTYEYMYRGIIDAQGKYHRIRNFKQDLFAEKYLYSIQKLSKDAPLRRAFRGRYGL